MFRSLLILAALLVLVDPAHAANPQLDMCDNRPDTSKKTCLVNGDTLWLTGEHIRLQDFDTPDPQAICGGHAEVALARFASARLLQLLNSSEWTIERFGYDSTSGKSRLATIRIEGADVGDILISEGLARQWPDGAEFWCQ